MKRTKIFAAVTAACTALTLFSACNEGVDVPLEGGLPSGLIGTEAAAQRALTHAGLSAEEVSGLVTDLDEDDGKIYYNVEFWHKNTDYDYDIDAASGDVLSVDRDTIYYPTTENPPENKYIGENAAKEKAFAHAGIQESDAVGIRVYLDRDDGVVYYDVEFWCGYTEYDYEIDAVSGEVLSVDTETKQPVAPAESSSSEPAPAESSSSAPAVTSSSSATQAPPPQTQAPQYIGEKAAKEKALAHAGLKESDIVGLKIKFDFDDGRYCYNVEFWSGNTEYDYDIDALTGEIISFDKDTRNDAPLTPPAEYIGEAAAKAAALQHAGVKESDTAGMRVTLERDDGVVYYDVEFWAGNTEYDYEIDAKSGKVLSFDKETKYAPSTGEYIGEAAAKAKALAHAGLSEAQVTRLKVELDEEDGRICYKVEFHADRTEYEYEIDAVSGEILKAEKDVD